MTYYNDVGDANIRLQKATQASKVFRAAAVMAGKFCGLRRSHFCYLDCDCRAVCDVSGLSPLHWGDLPEEYKNAARS